MIKETGFIILCLFTTSVLSAQDSPERIDSVIGRDAIQSLPAITVRAYEQHQSILTLPAAVNVISSADLGNNNNTGVLQAVNTAPGVRMEERSPGSYRLGIRGSALESPFGVRSVKVYYNGIPYSDPSGNTYLNQLGLYNMQSLEIIKGPASSLYGAGTGGVLLINSMPAQWTQGATINYTGGSYGLSNTEAEIRIGDSGSHSVVRYQHMNSDGYRDQSKMRNDIISWDGMVKHGAKNELSVHVLYGDLYYQTPGGLNLQEYTTQPKNARPGAIQANAAIRQQTFISGFSYKQLLSTRWTNTTTLYGIYTTQANPNLRNFSITSEPNAGGRTVFTYQAIFGKSSLQWTTGSEVQQELAQNKTYNNINGRPQNLQTDQQVNNGQVMGFTQLNVQTGKWLFTSGVSVSRLRVNLKTISATAYTEQNKAFDNQVAPRVAVLHRVTNNLSLYAAVKKGYSPPTIDELAPTGSQVNFDLQPKQGWNYEAGLRGFVIEKQLYFDVNAFYFRLQNTIVQRRDSSGGDYYINSGNTQQTGIEILLKYNARKAGRIITPIAWLGYSFNHFRYHQFIQIADDYSGNTMPGTPANAITAGATLLCSFGVYLNANYYFGDKIVLNDANTAFADPYHLLGCKLGYKLEPRKYLLDIFAGTNNMLNQKYSLGNDINAINGRYYNAAQLTSYFAGVSVGYLK